MDPRHQLYKSLDKLAVDPDTEMADADAASGGNNSGVTIEGLKGKLQRELGAVHVEIADLSGMRNLHCRAM
jgi:hypothetical protein